MATPLSIFDNSSIILPQRIEMEGQSEGADICIRFLRYLSRVPNSNLEIKVLSAIQYSADMLDYSDARAAKTLVELGLRAPRKAFPADFLNFIDQALTRDSWEIGSANDAMHDLARYWVANGENAFVAVNREFDLVNEGTFV